MPPDASPLPIIVQAPGFERVMAPGDPEARSRQARAGAIPLPDETWRQIAAAAEVLGVTTDAGPG